MTTYRVKYLQFNNDLSNKYFDFLKAVRVVEIAGQYYPVQYDTSAAPKIGPFGNPYIAIDGQNYDVTCKGEITNKDITLNDKAIIYQAVDQICTIDVAGDATDAKDGL